MTYWKAYKDGFHFWSALHEIMNFKVFSILICNASESIYGGLYTILYTPRKWGTIFMSRSIFRYFSDTLSALGKIMKADQDQYIGYGPDSLFWALNSQPNSKETDDKDAVTYQKRSLPHSLASGNWNRENIGRSLFIRWNKYHFEMNQAVLSSKDTQRSKNLAAYIGGNWN